MHRQECGYRGRLSPSLRRWLSAAVVLSACLSALVAPLFPPTTPVSFAKTGSTLPSASLADTKTISPKLRKYLPANRWRYRIAYPAGTPVSVSTNGTVASDEKGG